MTQEQPGHWIERGPQKRLMVFSGRSHSDLAHRIAEQLGVQLGEVELSTFANGETYCRFDESIRGADIFIVQTGCEPVDRNVMELLFMVQAAKLASAKRITAVIPLFPYARQDRKAKPREPISARLIADMLQLAGADRVLTMDLHAGQIQGFFTIPVDHMTAVPLFARHFRDLGLTGEGVVSVSPDAGRAKQAVRFAEMLDADFALMHKSRPAHDVVEVTEVTGRVRGKTAILGDDVIMTGGTLLANVKALQEHGVEDVWVFATHGLFCGNALREVRRLRHQGHRRHRHGPDRSARQAGQDDRPAGRAAARRDDHERLRRRLRLGDLRRREPALLGRAPSRLRSRVSRPGAMARTCWVGRGSCGFVTARHGSIAIRRRKSATHGWPLPCIPNLRLAGTTRLRVGAKPQAP